ncbi:hypothetical protein ACSAZL_14605 [Methanosarcina sp. T3]|uniref:hypothetical protein n=1 Tax=Methanosarcina sp. T3 TaxID=3439062 RepID=UPI003F827C5A
MTAIQTLFYPGLTRAVQGKKKQKNFFPGYGTINQLSETIGFRKIHKNREIRLKNEGFFPPTGRNLIF